MVNGKKVVVVMPAYNAESTLRRTFAEVRADIVDDVVLVDDASSDATAEVARSLGIETIVHPANKGYGGNQKTCYKAALERGADIVVMLHPDYQYTPALIPSMAWLIAVGQFDCVLGSRILGTGALKGGMPLYKYVSNRFLTLVQNWLVGQKISEYHTGYRAFSREILETLPLDANSDDFVFDNQMLVQIIHHGFSIGEISCPTRYEEDSSSINFTRSAKYGLGVLWVSACYRLQRMGLMRSSLFPETDGKDGEA